MQMTGMIVLSYLHLCFRDKDGYYWLTGRVDDVINVRYLLDFIIFPLVTLGQASKVDTYIKYVHTKYMQDQKLTDFYTFQ